MPETLRDTYPYWLKRTFRFFNYRDERKRFFREIGIKKEQDQLIRKYNRETENLVIFLVPGADRKTGKDTISGGVTSLVSLCEESAKLSKMMNAEVLMTVFPREFLLLKHENFENNVDVFRFEQLPTYFTKLKSVLIHIPEFLVAHFEENLLESELKWLVSIPKVHVNVINANILLMPSEHVVKQLESVATKITITAAHTKYCTQYYRDIYGVPIHKFSAWISPEQYVFVPYEKKEDIIVISPDQNENKAIILSRLGETKLELKILENLTYKDFKELVGRAKWALTFGEGLDGYILEPIFSGTVAFAVYNEDFFTPDFEHTNGIYGSYNEMLENIVSDIRKLDNPESYKAFQKEQFDLCAKHYNYETYQRNIRLFYEEKYSFK
ncbi:hypothetical protein EXU57_17645 [Segetibacter sp. 3557_3]|uniref:hypothetical protein n=1 Tax=Segetibacter sp. 3557_3 TaxID=2547429 RepID=UPI001058F54D|nr:hypothetical protein [Segetibacter sp. 3557_3]TDH23297.1 hypothetical protein EXU57_17645 [Segetibacter sp. 3557_3]